MSTASPLDPSSSSLVPAAPAPAPQPAPTPYTPEQMQSLVFAYLRDRGFTRAEQSLRDELAHPRAGVGGNVMDIHRLVNENVPGAELGTAVGVQSVAGVNVVDALAQDPGGRYEAFRDLESWVDGSLDIYRPEFRQLLFPIFCHFYLDLVERGWKDAATQFFSAFSPSLLASHAPMLHRLSTVSLPAHVASDEIAKRFRDVHYRLRMSKSGFGLFVGWLTDGIGGTGGGVGEGFGGERSRRVREYVLKAVNRYLKIDVIATTSSLLSLGALEETTGLVSALVPSSSKGSTTAQPDPQSFNASQPALKLGKPPLDPSLRDETLRVVKEELDDDGEPLPSLTSKDRDKDKDTADLISPASDDMPPLPPGVKKVDVEREVAKVRDERKRIRLDPSLSLPSTLAGVVSKKTVALPSVCCYTLYDAPDGSVPCATFSQDASLLAAGFEQSYVRVWNLKGERIKGLRSDFDANNVRDARDLRRLREKGGTPTRKLIGHSAPVTSLSFDPLAGSAAPPHWLLSSSADSTVRLWSLDTLSNVVAYRGHEAPVWDVQWGPMGTYFASGSRDRTARLWTTERIAPLRVFAGHLSDVDCVKFHPNSLYLATGSSDWTARLWDVQLGSCVRVFVGHQGALSALAFSPDGRLLATAASDLAISLWDLGSGRRIKKMTGHAAAVHSLAFSQEASVLVSGGADWTVRCWDVKAPGGLPGTGMGRDERTTGAGALPLGAPVEVEEKNETTDLLATWPTKRTPIVNVQFTPRNMCLVAGPIQPSAAQS